MTAVGSNTKEAVVCMDENRQNGYLIWKRGMDILLSAAGIMLLCIPMAVIALLIKIDSPGPVLFRQKRVGINKKHFYILKFRSMPVSVPKDVPTHEFHAVDALSPFQRFIRRTSLDELPQLINILCGDMSVVGPRPALWNQFDLIAERDKYGANSIRPGLTGWAQINGRDELSIEEKAGFDGEYVRSLSFRFDLRCFFGTFLKVLRQEGIVEGGKDGNAKE